MSTIQFIYENFLNEYYQIGLKKLSKCIAKSDVVR